jgi:hypothetical protein
MEDIDRTFEKLRRPDVKTVQRMIFEKSRAPGEDNGPIWLEDWGSSLKRFNPIYLKIINDCGWEIQEFLDEVYKNDK